MSDAEFRRLMSFPEMPARYVVYSSSGEKLSETELQVMPQPLSKQWVSRLG